MKKLIALFSIGLFASAVTMLTGIPILASAGTLFGASLFSPKVEGAAYAGLNKEVWLDTLKEDFYADDMFLSEMVDMSAFVDNDIINLAEAGVNPDVLINNTSYPIAVSQRTDAPIALPLDTYDTTNTMIRNIEKATLSYDKIKSVTYGHKQALKMTFMEYAAYRIAPSADTTDTPLIVATGADNGSGVKRLRFKDVAKLRKRFDNAEMPATGRILVLSAQHQEDLEVEDVDRYNRVTEKGVSLGFKIYYLAEKRLPRYNNTTGAQVAFGAAGAGTDAHASLAFHKDEVMRAQGTQELFSKENDPEQRADILGFQMRGLSMPIRGKGIAAIYSPVV